MNIKDKFKLFGISKYLFQLIKKVKSLALLNLPRLNKNYFIAIIDSHVIHYPTPITLTYAWSFGSLAGICLVIQFVSGILLAMHYTPNINLAFSSIEYIMRDVRNGWLIRYIHANGASMFFMVVYCHICRGLYYGSYMEPRQWLWVSGVILFFLMMGTAFSGYVLPWGQMSFWGATVITSMVTIIPIGAKHVIQWLWGGYTIKNPTLQRFFILHFLLPFVIAGFTLIHLVLLHKVGSNTPLGADMNGIDDVPFYPYYFTKDLFAFSCFLIIFGVFVFYYPNVLNHPTNCIPADPFETPAHVVPEWYFLAYYAILRCIPHKAAGIIAMFASIFILFLIPFINTSEIRNTTYRPIFKIFFWLFIADFIILVWSGQKPITKSYIFTAKVATVYYFFFFLIVIPVVGKIESILARYKTE